MFRKDIQCTGASNSTAPGTPYLQWVFNTSATEVHNSPAAANGTLFVAASNGCIYAINASTGQQIWMQTITNNENSVWSSPAIDSGRLFIGARDHKLYCLNQTTGVPLWQYIANEEIDASPVTSGNKVIVNTINGTVYCIDYETALLLWKFDGNTNGGAYFGSPSMIDENSVLIAEKNLYLINALTGQLIWEYNSSEINNPAAISNGKIFVCSGSSSYNSGDALVCVDAVSGLKVWGINFTGNTGGLHRSAPAVANGIVFFQSSLTANNFFAVNATTGSIIWTSTIGSFDFCSSPSIADGKVFIGGDDGKLYCLNSTTGQTIWSYLAGSTIRSSPIVAYGNIYVGCNAYSGFFSNTPGGQVFAFGSQPLIYTNLTLAMTSQTSLLGYSVTLTGKYLLENQSAISNTMLRFSYSIDQGQTWNDITSTYTTIDGSFSVVWTPSATGTFLVKVANNGLFPYYSSQKIVQLSVLPYNNQYVFTVSSNSTVSLLAFNSQTYTLTFTVSGVAGTNGYVDMQIAKNLIADISNLKVSIDGNNVDYTVTSMSDTYSLRFSYNHSTHSISVDLGTVTSTPTPTPTSTSTVTPTQQPTKTPTPTPTLNPSPSIPEYSTVVIAIILMSITGVTIILKVRNQRK
jgi:outer membrane protein assembly factor BamB